MAERPRLRELREGDAAAVADLYRTEFGGDRPMDAAEIAAWFRNETIRPEWLRVLEEGGRVVGYGDIAVGDEEIALEAAAPGRWDVFLDWAEEEARTRRRRRVRTYIPSGHPAGRTLAARGYRRWRSGLAMRADLEPAPPPALPAGIRVSAYRDSDAEPVRAALNEAFAADPFFRETTPEEFREWLLLRRGFDPGLWVLGWDGGELAGVVLGFGESPGEPAVAWIEEVAVRPAWRRRGLGEALLRTAFLRLHAAGLRSVELGVDAENPTGAVRLYERVGMRAVRGGDHWVLDL